MHRCHCKEFVDVYGLCENGKQYRQQFLPVWSTTVTAVLFSAYLHLSPPVVGSHSNFVARCLTLTLPSARAGKAVPTVAPASG